MRMPFESRKVWRMIVPMQKELRVGPCSSPVSPGAGRASTRAAAPCASEMTQGAVFPPRTRPGSLVRASDEQGRAEHRFTIADHADHALLAGRAVFDEQGVADRGVGRRVDVAEAAHRFARGG